MSFWKSIKISACCLLMLCAVGFAQSGASSLRGQVTDPTGAVVVGAAITLTAPAGKPQTTISDKQGNYEFKSLDGGLYQLKCAAKGFAIYSAVDLKVPAKGGQQLDISLDLATQKQVVEVDDSTEKVDVSPANSGATTVIKGQDLEMLSDDPDELESDLQALAGPSVGPNGGEIYIDGFSNGQMPPKSAIREIRINQNPFTAQYDHIGFGRVEVFTKPGKDQWHGQVMIMDNDKSMNSMPETFNTTTENNVSTTTGYASNVPHYNTLQGNINLSGPINSRASFSFNAERRNINDVSLISANENPKDSSDVTTGSLGKPQRRTNITPRFDYQFAENNTFSARYSYMEGTVKGNGVGGASLASRAYSTFNNNHELQLSDTQAFGSSVINETRLEIERNRTNSTPSYYTSGITDQLLRANAAFSANGNVNAGGSTNGYSEAHTLSTEFQNYTSIAKADNFIRFGARVRTSSLTNNSLGNGNGSFTYTNLQDWYSAYVEGVQVGVTPTVSAQQYSITLCGDGSSVVNSKACRVASNTQVDAGLYAEDDWKIRPNITLSYGVRFETQNNIDHHFDFAPRLGLAYGLGSGKSSPKTVLRGAFGLFYDRFSQNSVMNTMRFNGSPDGQQSYIIDCKQQVGGCIPDAASITGLHNVSSFASAAANVYQLGAGLRTPYNINAAFTVERQLTRSGKISSSYIFSRGNHMINTIDVNPEDMATGARAGVGDPNLDKDNVYRYTSSGIFKMTMWMTNGQVSLGKRLMIMGFFGANWAHSDSAGAPTVSSTKDLMRDWGHVSWMPPQMGMINMVVTGPWGIRLTPMISANSASYYNITVNQDVNGDGNYNNDRPTWATASTPVCPTSGPLPTTECYIQTRYGKLVANPTAADMADPKKIIPFNLGRTHAQLMVNMRVSKTFGIGPKLNKGGAADMGMGGGPGGPGGPRGGHGGGPFGGMFGSNTSDRKYSLTFSADFRNLFNNVNLSTPVSVLGNSNFDHSTSMAGGWGATTAANRTIRLQVQFGF